jgi:predicted transcriptional regulator
MFLGVTLMSDSNRPDASEAEREILRVLWDEGPGTVREVQQRLDQSGTTWQRSTVLTLLQRLEKKGHVTSDQSSSTFVFDAAVTREDMVHQRMKDLAEELADGRPASLLLAFAERTKFTKAELTELRTFIDGLLKKDASAARKRSGPKGRGGDRNE